MKNKNVKRVIAMMLIVAFANMAIACGNDEKSSSEVQSAETDSVDIESEIPADEGIICEYEENSDGTWSTASNNYKYRLELTGRAEYASVETTYVVLSNDSSLSFEDVSKSFLSSDSNDWLDEEEACVVQAY